MSDLKTGLSELEKARSYTKSSVFALRFSPEWESVQRHTRRAIDALKMAGDSGLPHLLDALKLGIESFEHTGSYLQCGAYSDERGDLVLRFAQGTEDADKKKALYLEAETDFRQAAKYQRLHGNNEKNVATLLKASKCLASVGQIDKAIQSAQEACQSYENDHRLIGAEKHLTEVLLMIIQANQWARVPSWLQFQVKILDKRRDLYGNSIFHCYLGEIVVLLSLGEYEKAFEQLVHYEDNDEDFRKSEHHNGAKALISACNSDDTEALAKARKDWPIIKYLQREIALLVPQLKLNPQYCGYNREVESDGEGNEGKEKKNKEKGAYVDASDALADGML